MQWNRFRRPSVRKQLAWEARCIPCEVAATGLGLALGLGLGDWGVGGLVLFAVCCMSFLVRLLHYGGVGSRQSGAA